MTVYVLMFYGIDEADVFGVVSSKAEAMAWAKSDSWGHHCYVKFTVGKVRWPSWVPKEKRTLVG